MIRFSDILGQDAAIEALQSAYRSERLPHGLIFAGPVGVGKATTARALAALFLCQKPGKDSACGNCESCRAMSGEAHPDFHRIYRQLVREMKKDSVARDLAKDVIDAYLISPASRTTVMGTGKVFVVEESDLMSTAAQNSLLKTLEEPQGRTLLILLTDQPSALLPTIRSRCQIIRFAALDAKLVREQLKKRGIPAAQAEAATNLAEGSLGLAIKWIEDGLVDASAELIDKLDGMLTGKPWPKLQEWFRKAADGYAEKQLERDEKASKDQATREGLSLYLRIAAEHVRRKLRQIDDPATLDQFAATIEACHATDLNIDSNVNVALALQQLNVALEEALVRA